MNEKRKLPLSIQKPTYDLPKNEDFSAWCEWRIHENNRDYERRLRESRDRGKTLDFYKAQGIIKYS